ncbi:HypC/HybG/HupF family hydrogenase formation chaperone [Jiella marina]|uniref:HypC/HybG/HupF family hydrogenase formation chaperone n=1 Tax=Jiella sp. LLJ827 TaxID=2917712 RepID=UPI0021007C63|nr:HypC/HybG/HupF family hydrogenase formation chaperone [Jiella sp. LLJ827]MCQ0988221.1 HypC/HybG/HupF family hydrogenase formation chaperone [Jiella sp. LLJ827]
MCLGIPGRIAAIRDAERRIASVDFSGVRRDVDLTCVAEGALDDLVGTWVLVHVGFAMSVIDEAEAQRTLEALAELGEAEEEYAAMRESAAMLEERP